MANKNEMSSTAELPEWWPQRCECEGMIFTPLIGDAGETILSAEEMCDKWISSQDNPISPPPTLEERIAALEAVQLEQILGGAV